MRATGDWVEEKESMERAPDEEEGRKKKDGNIMINRGRR